MIAVDPEGNSKGLGWAPRPIEDTIAETGESLIRHGVAATSAAAWLFVGR